MGAGTALYQVVEMDSQELLDEFLKAVSEDREATFVAISLDDPSLTPEKVEFVVSVKEVHVTKPIFVDVVDIRDSRISFRIQFPRGLEAIRFGIII